jgi:RNA polymerase sigma-70 factor (ECF subfamily)
MDSPETDVHEVRAAPRLEFEPVVSEGQPEQAVPAEPSDETLARSAAAGDERACARLIKRYLRRTLAVAAEYAPNLADAEDIAQDAFRRMFEALGRFDATRPFAPWYYTILRNVARNVAKSGRGRVHEVLSNEHVSEQAGPAEHAERAQLRHRIRNAVTQLPPMQAACFRLCLVEGLSRVEAAAALGLAESTVRVHVFQARRTLQKLLREWRYEVD